MDNILKLKIKMRVTTTKRFVFQLDNILILKTEMQVTTTHEFSTNSVKIKGEKGLHRTTYIHGFMFDAYSKLAIFICTWHLL